MNTATLMAPSQEYILGRTAAEYERLNNQALQWEQVTQRVLKQAGLKPGMDCLDAGCGTGSVMRLMGKMTGKAGSVTGFDENYEMGDYVLSRLTEEGDSRYFFEEGNIEKLDTLPGAPYDFVYARFFLLHLNNPVDGLKKLYAALKPGGILLVQDYYFETLTASEPGHAFITYFKNLITNTFSAMGKDPAMGIRLPFYFNQATGKPVDGTDASSLITPMPVAIEMMKAVFKSMLPSMKKAFYADEDDYKQFSHHANGFLKQPGFVSALWPMLGAAWVKK